MPKNCQSKIGVPFHPLTADLAKQWYKSNHLTTTGYLLAIKGIIRPPGVNLVISNVLEFCREWGITKSAFYRAVNALKASGDLDWEATEGIILKSCNSKVLPLFKADEPSHERDTCPTSGTPVPPPGHLSHERDSQSHLRDSQSHERDSQSHLRDTDIYKDRARADYLDYSDSLSDSERESFERFVREEWRKLKREEIISLERFLASDEDIKNWHEKFLNSPAGRAAKEEAIATQFDWRNDPRFDDWIWKAFSEGVPWAQEDETEREQRYAFLKWARATNAYKGMCY